MLKQVLIEDRSSVLAVEGSMKRRVFLRLFVLFLACALIAVPALAKKKPKSTEPGKYKDWHGDIDVIEILEKFSMADYNKIVVTGFDSTDVELPDKDDNTYEPVKEVLKDTTSAFVEGLRGKLEKEGVTVEAGEGGGAGTLVISGTVVEMDPGSRAARYWGGFGAGAARGHLEIIVKDGGTGNTLLKIDQERRSGFGGFGGDYVGLMNKNLKAIGKDMALVFDQF